MHECLISGVMSYVQVRRTVRARISVHNGRAADSVHNITDPIEVDMNSSSRYPFHISAYKRKYSGWSSFHVQSYCYEVARYCCPESSCER